jgi:hypothetical protein
MGWGRLGVGGDDLFVFIHFNSRSFILTGIQLRSQI